MATRTRLAKVETLEGRQLLASMMLAQYAINGNSPGRAEIDFVEVGGGGGDSSTQGYDDGHWFVADSFSFGVEREMKESGEKGGTADINIGVGELEEMPINPNGDAHRPALSAAFEELADDSATGEVAFYYNKIALNYATTHAGCSSDHHHH